MNDGVQSGQATAKKAAAMLVAKNIGYTIPTRSQKRNLLVAFAGKGKVLYGQAFDIIKSTQPVNLGDVNDIRAHFDQITIAEIKSTRKSLGPDFSGYFFALTAGEVLVAQSLREQYRFVLVNTTSSKYLELSLTEVFARARGIYPTWSIAF